MAEQKLVDKNVLIVGGTAGVGAAAAHRFAAEGAQVLMLGRDRLRGERLAAEISLETRNHSVFALSCDLSSPEQVHRAAEEVLRRCRRLDVLINNAGLFRPRRELTPEGHEKTFASLYLGPFLLTQLLLEGLHQSQQARVICVTCPPAKARVDFDDLTLARKYSTLRAQYQAKGALFMFVRELARRTQGSDITVNAILPALMIKTELLRNMSILWRLPVALFGVTAEKAADSLFWLATDPGLDSVTGRYFYGRTEQAVTGPVADDAACLRLWELTLQMLGLPPNAF